MERVIHSLSHRARIKDMILIVEDEPLSRRLLAALLEAKGYAIGAVSSAEEALNLLQQGYAPAIALVDVDLPGMCGLDLVRQIAQSNPSIVPILITATDRERIDAFRNHYPICYMPKPINVANLLDFINAGLSAPFPAQAASVG